MKKFSIYLGVSLIILIFLAFIFYQPKENTENNTVSESEDSKKGELYTCKLKGGDCGVYYYPAGNEVALEMAKKGCLEGGNELVAGDNCPEEWLVKCEMINYGRPSFDLYFYDSITIRNINLGNSPCKGREVYP